MATDAVGFTATGQSVQWTVDATAPTAPTSASFGTVPADLNHTPPISPTGMTDTGSGVAMFTARVLLASTSAPVSGWQRFKTGQAIGGLLLSPITAYKLTVRAVDGAGNAGPASTSGSWTSANVAAAAPDCVGYSSSLIPGSSGNVTVRAGVTTLCVIAVGGGGGSGPGNGTTGSGKGGAGGYVRSLVPVTPGESLTAVVGLGAVGVLEPSPGFLGSGGGGGGYTALLRGSTPLVVAGGGGGGFRDVSLAGDGGSGCGNDGFDAPVNASGYGGGGGGGTATAGGHAGLELNKPGGGESPATDGASLSGGQGSGSTTATYPGGAGGSPGGGKGGNASSLANGGGGGGGGGLFGGGGGGNGTSGSTGGAAGGGGGGSCLGTLTVQSTSQNPGIHTATEGMGGSQTQPGVQGRIIIYY
jgi:hypothetical protein